MSLCLVGVKMPAPSTRSDNKPRQLRLGNRALGESGQGGQEQLGRDVGDCQVVADRFLQAVGGQRSTQSQLEQVEGVLTEQ